MKCVGKKLVIYSSTDQSNSEVSDFVSMFFEQPDCVYNRSHMIAQFKESPADIESRALSQLKAAIRTCQSQNAGLLIVRDFKGKGYLETLYLLRDSGLLNIMTIQGELLDKYIEKAIALEVRKRQRISESRKKVLAIQKADGVALGNPSFLKIRNSDTKAANDAKKDQAYNDALKLIAEIDKLPAREKYSHNNIAHRLNHRGITTRRGKPINRGTIRRAYIRVKECD